jgi:hypothetical protein
MLLSLPRLHGQGTLNAVWTGGYKRAEKWTDVVKTDKYTVCSSYYSSSSSGASFWDEWSSSTSSSKFEAKFLSSETVPETRYVVITYEMINPVGQASFLNAPLTDEEAKVEFDQTLYRCQKSYVNPNDRFNPNDQFSF